MTFKSDVDWTVEVPSTVNWCTVSPSQGQAGTASVLVKIIENREYDERNVSLTLKCELNTVTYVISQKQRDALLLSSSKVEMDTDGGTFTVEVQSNVQVTCEIPAQYGGWLKVADGSRGLSTKSYAFTVSPNSSGDSRQGQVIFKSGTMRETVDVYQYCGDVLILGSHEATLPALGGRVEIDVRSNVDYGYTVAEGSDWIHQVESRALSSHTVYFIIDAYSETENGRIGIIKFTSTDGTLSELFTVGQKPQGAVIVNTGSIEADYAGGTYEIELATNCDIAVSGPSEWVRFGDMRMSRGMSTYIQEIKVSPNYNERERRCELKFYSKEDKEICGTVALIQGALQYTVTTTLPQEAYRDARSHVFDIGVDTRAPYELLPSSDRLESMGNGRFRLKANYSKGESGMHTIGLKVAGQYVTTIGVNYSEPITPVISQNAFNVSGEAGKVRVVIQNNTDIECEIQSAATGWISRAETNIADAGIANDVWTFAVAENGAEGRTGTITFRAGDIWKETVSISQETLHKVENSSIVSLDGTKTLTDILGDNIYNIEALDLRGIVSAADISTMRSMATEGKLTDLDMSMCELKRDDKPYCWPEFSHGGFISADNVVGDYMFYGTMLKRVKLPDAAVSVGERAFFQSPVEEVEFGSEVRTIGWQCFKECDKLRKVNIPDLVEEIPDYCFFGTYALEELKLGKGLKRIGNRSLCPIDCYNVKPSKLVSVVLPDGLEEIGFKAFCSTGITSMIIPSSVRRIEPYAFEECRNLNSIKFENEMDTLPPHILENTIGLREIVFPRGLKVIGAGALAGSDIEYLTIPEGVVELESNSLSSAGRKGCILPQSLEVIGPRALCWRSQCSEFTIPANVKRIGNAAFMGTWSVKKLHIQCPTPPVCEGKLFTTSVADCTLYVPKGSAGLYHQAEPWSDFKEIVEE